MKKSGWHQKKSNQEDIKSLHDITKLILSNKNAIKNPWARIQAFIDPSYEEWLKNEYINEVNILLEQIKIRISELEPWIEKIRNNIIDISEEHPIIAAYCLLQTILQSFHAILLLWKEGYYLEIMTLGRKIEEANMQCSLFMLDYNEWMTKNINDWFSWKIISHKLWRERLWNLHNDSPVDIGAMSNYIYRMESNISHNGYIGMIEMISPFRQDFDKNGSTRLYRTIWGLEQILRQVDEFAILLKTVYLYWLKDPDWFDKIDSILLRFSPNISSTDLIDKMKQDFPKVKK